MGNRAVLAASALALAGAGVAGDPDPLVNPGFATDLDGWTVLFGRPAAWSPLDVQAAPDSGSARVTNVLAPSNGGTPLTLRQCLPVPGGTGWLFAADVLLPAGEPVSTGGQLYVYGHDDAACGLGIIASASVTAFGSVDSWIPVAGQLSLPAGTRSISISLGVRKDVGISAPASAHFDQVVLILDQVFVDGFDRSKP